MFVMPTESGNFIARYLLRREIQDRDAALILGLFTNPLLDLTTTLASLVRPTGIGYEGVQLEDGDWVVTGRIGVQAQRQFTAGAGGWNGLVQGYYIATQAAGGTPRLVGFEFDHQQQLAPGAVTRVGSLVSVATPSPHLLADGGLVNVTGALQPEYNGAFAVSVAGPNSFTYTVSGTPLSPATGVILVNRCFQMNVGATYDVDLSLAFGS